MRERTAADKSKAVAMSLIKKCLLINQPTGPHFDHNPRLRFITFQIRAISKPGGDNQH